MEERTLGYNLSVGRTTTYLVEVTEVNNNAHLDSDTVVERKMTAYEIAIKIFLFPFFVQGVYLLLMWPANAFTDPADLPMIGDPHAMQANVRSAYYSSERYDVGFWQMVLRFEGLTVVLFIVACVLIYLVKGILLESEKIEASKKI